MIEQNLIQEVREEAYVIKNTSKSRYTVELNLIQEAHKEVCVLKNTSKARTTRCYNT